MPRAHPGESPIQRKKRVEDEQVRRATLRPPVIDPNQNYRVEEAAAALSRSPARLYTEIREGRILGITPIGMTRKTLVPGTEIIRIAQADRAAATKVETVSHGKN